MASGSHEEKGSCALLLNAATIKKKLKIFIVSSLKKKFQVYIVKPMEIEKIINKSPTRFKVKVTREELVLLNE